MTAGDPNESANSAHLWRALGIAGAIAGGFAGGAGVPLLRDPPPPAYTNGSNIEPRVRTNSENIAALAASIDALRSHIVELSAERERRFVAAEHRIEELYDRDRAIDSRLRLVEGQRR